MRTALSVILFALLFWLIFIFTVGTFVFFGGAGDSNPFGDAFGLSFLLALSKSPEELVPQEARAAGEAHRAFGSPPGPIWLAFRG